MDNITSLLRPLTPEQRMDARDKAREITKRRMGTKPKREDFKDREIGKYPEWMINTVIGLSLTALLSAFILSAMRLYHIGNLEFFKTIADRNSAVAAGFFIVLLSETCAVLFTLALSVLGKSRTTRAILITFIFASTALALSGNYYVALWGHKLTLFSVLEAMLPPTFVIGIAFIIKEVFLQKIERLQREEALYQTALMQWEVLTADPDSHPEATYDYSDALKAAIYEANKLRKVTWVDGEKERVADIMLRFTDADWVIAVQSEMDNERWFKVTPEPTVEPTSALAQEAVRTPGFLPMPSPVASLTLSE